MHNLPEVPQQEEQGNEIDEQLSSQNGYVVLPFRRQPEDFERSVRQQDACQKLPVRRDEEGGHRKEQQGVQELLQGKTCYLVIGKGCQKERDLRPDQRSKQRHYEQMWKREWYQSAMG